MAGYHGNSMSNNAIAAYEFGEKPFSKWTKSAILAELDSLGFDSDLAKKLTVSEMKALFLRRSSWHHTSSFYNRTDFYSVSDAVTAEMIDAVIASRTEAKPETSCPYEMAKVHYLTWTGSRKHPKATECVDYALINENWALLPDGTKKKRNANGFYVIEKYSRTPKGQADTFKTIRKMHDL